MMQITHNYPGPTCLYVVELGIYPQRLCQFRLSRFEDGNTALHFETGASRTQITVTLPQLLEMRRTLDMAIEQATADEAAEPA